MPKAKPTQVITHRIELGQWERDNLAKPVGEIVQTGAEYAEVAKLIKTGMFGALGVASVGAVYLGYKIGKSIYDWIEPDDDSFSSVLEDTVKSPWKVTPFRVVKSIFS